MDVLDGFTEAARHALSAAPEEMERWHQEWIGPEHLLLALLRDGSSVAGTMLAQLGATDELRRRLESILGQTGLRTRPPARPYPSAKQVIVAAQEEARRAGAAATGTGHLILGLLAASDSDVARILQGTGVGQTTVREMLPHVVALGEEAGGG